MVDTNTAPYSLGNAERREFLSRELSELMLFHYDNCEIYRNILDGFGKAPRRDGSITDYKEIPFIPVRLFKEYELLSTDRENIVKSVTSSGTTGQKVSKIFLDRETAAAQTKVLTKIVSEFIGTSRLPMIIMDSPSVIRNRAMFSARGAGILGFQIFGRDKFFALDDEMKLDIDGLSAFLEKHKGERILIFGFTFMIWQHFCEVLRENGCRPDLSQAVMIHGGGWKKLADKKISHDTFHSVLNEVCGISSIHDYYGMAEQTGTIYMECECGHIHSSIYSDIIIRKPEDFSECAVGEEGIIQTLSLLPHSYPGFSLLTEDKGILLGEDECPCGRKGRYFRIIGRMKNAEIRGCSDTYADKFR